MTDLQSASSLWLGLAVSGWMAWIGVESSLRGERSRRTMLCSAALLALGVWWPVWAARGALSWTAGGSLLFAVTAALLTVGASLALWRGRQGAEHRRVAQLAGVAGAAVLFAAALACLLLPGWPQGGDGLWLAGLGLLQSVALAAALRSQGRSVAPVAGRAVAVLLACWAPVAWRAPAALGELADAANVANVLGAPMLLSLPLLGMLALSGLLLGSRPTGSASEAGSRADPADAVREALTDPLTQLANRQAIERELEALAARCDRADQSMAVVVFNLDGFHHINIGLGHDVGDQVLRDVAQRLGATKGAQERIGRIAADEFVLVTPYALDMQALSARTNLILAELSKPFTIAGQDLPLGCSAGISLYPDHGAARRLVNCASQAAQAAKRLGGACFSVYTADMERDGSAQIELLKDLRLAIDRQEMELFFQPKIDAASGQVTSAEALLRWRHPTKGLVSPVVFIPVAERFGLMRDLGNWVIEAACAQARRWRDEGLRMRVAINLSVLQMRQSDIVDRIERALAEHRIQPELLTCEITESVAMEDTQATQQTFARLGALGLHLSIDDFGTGYSSLAYLRRLPASELKIDRSFVSEIDTNSNAWAVVKAIVRMAHAMNLRVVAEGVETESQQNFLVKLGCDELQGYLYAKPMSADAILLWAKNDNESKAHEFRASLFGDTQQADVEA